MIMCVHRIQYNDLLPMSRQREFSSIGKWVDADMAVVCHLGKLEIAM